MDFLGSTKDNALSLLNLVFMSLSGFYWYGSGYVRHGQLVSLRLSITNGVLGTREKRPYMFHLLVYDIVAVGGALLLCYVAFKKARVGNKQQQQWRFGRATLEWSFYCPWRLETKKPLDLEDVPQLHDSDSVVGLAPKFKTMLESSSDGGDESEWEILVTALFAFIYTVASYVGPALIDTFVQYLNGRRQYNNEGYVLVITFFLAKLVECLSQRHWFFRAQKAGFQDEIFLGGDGIRKSLTLSCHSKGDRTALALHDPWMILLQVGLALWILYRNLGLASIAALIATILVMLVNFPFGRMQERFQEKLMEAKDRRMKSTTEILEKHEDSQTSRMGDEVSVQDIRS
ncbi:ABC transporter C family member 3 [Raphanus sativus]|nr:ABC transporter C family member 3 [Raphanus sativus]